MEEVNAIVNRFVSREISFVAVCIIIYFCSFCLFGSFTEQNVLGKSRREIRILLDKAARVISYEAYVRGSNDNICTMVISLVDVDFAVCIQYAIAGIPDFWRSSTIILEFLFAYLERECLAEHCPKPLDCPPELSEAVQLRVL